MEEKKSNSLSVANLQYIGAILKDTIDKEMIGIGAKRSQIKIQTTTSYYKTLYGEYPQEERKEPKDKDTGLNKLDTYLLTPVVEKKMLKSASQLEKDSEIEAQKALLAVLRNDFKKSKAPGAKKPSGFKTLYARAQKQFDTDLLNILAYYECFKVFMKRKDYANASRLLQRTIAPLLADLNVRGKKRKEFKSLKEIIDKLMPASSPDLSSPATRSRSNNLQVTSDILTTTVPTRPRSRNAELPLPSGRRPPPPVATSDAVPVTSDAVLKSFDLDLSVEGSEQWVQAIEDRVSHLEEMVEAMQHKFEEDFYKIRKMMKKSRSYSHSGSNFSSEETAKIRAALRYLEKKLLG